MKKFLSKIMVFLILLTIIYIITAQTFHYLDLQVKGESGRMRYIHNELIADSIIMGSSRALHHYDPDILGNYYNVGEDRMASSSAWADCNYSSKDACPTCSSTM